MNREENKKFHNTYWGKIKDIFEKVDPDVTSLERLWAFVTYVEISNDFSLDINSFDFQNIDNLEIKNGFTPEYKSSLSQYFNEKLDLVISEIPEDTSHIVDLGSGWGRYSVILAKKYPSKKIFSLENSDSGVDACRILREKYNLQNLVCESFDYHDPSALKKHVIPSSYGEKAFYFSSYSIEQIPTLNRELFEIIIDADYDSVSGFHIEPIGWQVKGIKKNTISRYNNNLYPLLKTLQEEGLLVITKIKVDVYGKKTNPGTIVTWKKN